MSAIKWTKEILGRYNRCPENGLVVFCGRAVTGDGKERRVRVDFEPIKPVHEFVYLCDDEFRTDHLEEMLLADEETYGFIVIDGNGSLYGTVQGSNRRVLHQFSVDLPKKHGRGGQSALRFARLRLEKRHNYISKAADLATKLFIPHGQGRPNVCGIILAGSAGLKTELMRSNAFDQRLRQIITQTVDVSYGGDHGFQQAIELSSETLASVKLTKEKKLLQKYMNTISRDTGKFCFSIENTLQAFEMGAVENLILWEGFDMNRYIMRNKLTGEEMVVHLKKEESGEECHAALPGKETGTDFELVKKESFIEWVAGNYKEFGCDLDFVSDRSSEGMQFVKGFGGVGGILRWRVDFAEINGDLEQVKELDGDDSDCDVGDHYDEYGFDDGDFGL
uniref:Eukaryotic peptide chain release factor subunit 1 n=1 Tax=Ditylum brightwellii TaxID=49249 RepID=A0A7S2EHJ6_9STRA|mmetsp:Transcript_30734/g.45833  ORF Transcript_30734/g.45833 Transcript_30734/m.45833 type:complete len:392 (+) Transcript_30734:270-1445(+)